MEGRNMQSKFSHITQQLMNDLPTWFKMRRDPNTKGAQFLNIFGLQFEDIEFYLQYALDNQFIGTADIHQIDVIYKASIPGSIPTDKPFDMVGDGMRLHQMNTLKEFFEGIDTRFLERKEVYYPNPFYIDWERRVIYFKKSYGRDESFREGKVSMQLRSDDGTLLFEHDLPQTIHHVWNFFDEFGLLLDTPRLYAERNREYKERLLDVFRHPANATKKGLQHLLARELRLWQEVKWYDGSLDLVIKHSNVIEDSIEVDGALWASSAMTRDHSGRVVLLGTDSLAGQPRTVRFISGLQLHTFHNKSDYAFQDELYGVDRVATPMLQYYVDIITNQVPVMWDRFVWNESFWDVANKEMSGYGVVPNFHDARFLNWMNYKG
jgi:hypothetical protein